MSTPLRRPSTTPVAPANELRTAIRLARRMLAGYGDCTGWDVYAYAQAHGALAEALRILLRAVDAEPDAQQEQAGRPSATERRCPAAHPEDPTPCDGPAVVTVIDRQNSGAAGCEHHAVRLLASLDGGRVYALPDAPDGVAIRVFKAADTARPFSWLTDAPRTRPEQLSQAENRARGERR